MPPPAACCLAAWPLPHPHTRRALDLSGCLSPSRQTAQPPTLACGELLTCSHNAAAASVAVGPQKGPHAPVHTPQLAGHRQKNTSDRLTPAKQARAHAVAIPPRVACEPERAATLRILESDAPRRVSVGPR